MIFQIFGGGGKRLRGSDDMEQLFFIPDVKADDLDIVREILGMQKIDYEALIGNMQLQDLTELQKV